MDELKKNDFSYFSFAFRREKKIEKKIFDSGNIRLAVYR